MAYHQNLHGAVKMKIFSEAAFYTYQVTSLFSLATDGRGDVLTIGNPSKERDT